MADISQITLPDGNTYDIKDANATDTKVTQTQDDSTNNNFEILLAGSTSNTTATEGAKKTSGLVFNPSQQAITIGSRKANSTIGEGSFASGYNVEASLSYTHAEGAFTEASGVYAHAEGNSTTASGDSSHAEGDSTEASVYCAHAEGHHTTASNSCAHAEGDSTTASGVYAHAEGYDTEASGGYAHAEGGGTIASGTRSHAEGRATIANHGSQHVFGEFNIADPSAEATSDKGNYVEIVGNGTSTARSNARTLDWNGNEVLSGKLTVGAAPTNNMDVATKQYVDTGLAGAIPVSEKGANSGVATLDSTGKVPSSQLPTISNYTATGNIDISQQNVISRKEVWLTMAEYTALQNPDADTDYHITDGTLPYQTSVSDVEVDGVSVVSNNVANITNKVSRTGDTMTGNLAIEKNTPQVSEMDTRTTLDTSSNNGVTSNRITASLILIDSNGNSLGRLINEARTDGSVRTYLQTFNMKTNGDLAYNTFWLGVTKSGENVYYIASPSAFRSAIGIEPTSTTTGTNGGTVRRWGNIVSINFQGTTGTNIGSVPSGYRPQSTAERTIVYVEKYNDSTLTNRYYALLAVESNGNISCSYASSYGGTSFVSAKDANHKIYGNITYVIADND